ncbi:hypothetical protein [Ammoniphilus oxalaticus]|uniref:hypothetical protein n=1 Tax=Ammoniphilus oxalaticus TaxID=66863 RepID=UPI0014733289|nr:hypothetical protein [Ammoniphilus oxalaticus]
MDNLLSYIVIYGIGMFILYIVIETAVRRGINSSVIGRHLGQLDVKESKKSFLDDDLDN